MAVAVPISDFIRLAGMLIFVSLLFLLCALSVNRYCIILLLDAVISVHNLDTFALKFTLHKTKGATVFAVDIKVCCCHDG